MSAGRQGGRRAAVAKLADALDLGSSGAIRESSNLSRGTLKNTLPIG